MPTNSNGSSFYHSCLKVPINPSSGYPSPLFERKYDTFTAMSTQKDSTVSGSRPISGHSSNSIPRVSSHSELSDRKIVSDLPLKSFMEFYESIPDYGEMNHLSDEEFYRKIQNLKEKQKSYINSLNSEFSEENAKEVDKPEIISKDILNSDSNVCSDLHKGIVGVNRWDNQTKEKRGRASKIESRLNGSVDSNKIRNRWYRPSNACTRKNQKKFLEPSTSEESTVESIDNSNIIKKSEENTASELEESKSPMKSSAEKNSILVNRAQKKRQKQLINLSRDSSSKSVKKPYHRMIASSGSLVDSVWDNFSGDDYCSKSCHSFSDSDSNVDLRCHDFSAPRQSKSVAWREPKITVPEPFPMTVREKENQQMRLLRSELIDSKRDASPEEKKYFRAHPVPITSRIPLYDKIMNEQENRRMQIKKESIEKLKSKMKPFSFVRRDEEDRRCMLSHSSPDLHNMCKPIKMFRAKPVPKNLFSSHVYERMREDEFYRTLKKRIRSEELLRSSSLPPSMAAREKMSANKEKFELEENGKEKQRIRRKKNRKIPDYKLSHEILRMELEGRKNENITTTPYPFHFETDALHEKKSRRSQSAKRCCNASYCKNEKMHREKDRPVSAGNLTLHRENLASLLRIKSSRDKADKEKLRKRLERKQREEARLREREFRRNPAWKIVSGWGGVDEDLAIRACTRQQEENHRKYMHRRLMDNMMGRVYQIPTLFERQSQVLIPRKIVKEVEEKKASRIPTKDDAGSKKQRKLSVKLLSKDDMSLMSPSPRDHTKTDYDVSYETDPEDDKTCHQNIAEDIEDTGSEDEIKDEEEEVVDEKEGNENVKENMRDNESIQSLPEKEKPEEIKDEGLNEQNGDSKADETEEKVNGENAG